MARSWDYPGDKNAELGGDAQFVFLKKEGLSPDHYFLDVGYGPLNGGVRIIPYLEVGHYYGLDVDPLAVEVGLKYLDEKNLTCRKPRVVVDGNFGFKAFGQLFDFASAQSVFTHLPDGEIIKCLNNISEVLAPNGRFYATFLEGGEGDYMYHHPIGGMIRTHRNSDPFHQPIDFYRGICPMGLKLEDECGHIPGFEDPYKVLKFVKKN